MEYIWKFSNSIKNFLIISLKGSVIFLKSIQTIQCLTIIDIVSSFRFEILNRFSNFNFEIKVIELATNLTI